MVFISSVYSPQVRQVLWTVGGNQSTLNKPLQTCEENINTTHKLKYPDCQAEDRTQNLLNVRRHLATVLVFIYYS